MEEVYWISGAEFNYPPEEMTGELHYQKALAILENLMGCQYIRPGKVDEIHWQSDTEKGVLPGKVLADIGLPLTTPFFSWKSGGVFDHYLLQSAARTILVEDAHVIILGHQVGCATSALLLASPAAVGMYNLNPSARLALRLSVFGDGMNSIQVCHALQTQLKKRDFEAGRVNWLAFSEPCMENMHIADLFPVANVISVSAACPVGVLYQVNVLVNALQEVKDGVGMVVSRSTEGHVLATVLDRV